MNINKIVFFSLVLLISESAVAGTNLGGQLGVQLGTQLGQVLGSVLGSPLSISVGSILGLGAISLAIGIQILKRKKK